MYAVFRVILGLKEESHFLAHVRCCSFQSISRDTVSLPPIENVVVAVQETGELFSCAA